ncbi:g6706 [Coccomyxa viridis]|uniref:G6706 protein n=1 Tax=Coccomyxa viridis TaxID=1274662 RepID=A0ABP1FW04_9CHLO
MTHQANSVQSYYVIVQKDKASRSQKSLQRRLPQLPQNAQYIFHANACFDWGTFGWALTRLGSNTKAYKYYLFMNTSVRGPFLPSYLPATTHWTELFTSRINSKVKLVGSTISCEGVPDDYLGQAGYTIDCLMLRYQGIDWRNPINWSCNNKENPYADSLYDGVSVSPLEVVFVKYKQYLLDAGWSNAQEAAAYSRWMDEKDVPGTTNSNRMTLDKLSQRLARVVTMLLRGQECFDTKYYLKANPHYRRESSSELWADFVRRGQFRGDKFRFNCRSPLENDTVLEQIVQSIPALHDAHVRQ